MAGVISRSAYLEAKTPADGEEKGNSKRRLSVYFGISASSSRIWQSSPLFFTSEHLNIKYANFGYY